MIPTSIPVSRTTRFWFALEWAFAPLYRAGWTRPLRWAHVKGLRSYCRDIAEDAINRCEFPCTSVATPDAETMVGEKGDELMRGEFVLRDMETIGKRFQQEALIHEGCALVIRGTNARAVGWIDLHETFGGRVYGHHVISPIPSTR